MLIIELGKEELFDESTNTFVKCKPTTVRLEHSLISVAKWEAIHEKPFIPKSNNDPPKTKNELYSYVKCMVIGTITEEALYILWTCYGSYIDAYIHSESTATVIKKDDSTVKHTRREFITSELIYFWMITYNIPFEAQRWHLNRLLTLIEICNIKNNPQSKNKGKMSKAELRRQRNLLNAKRRSQLNSSG